MSPEFVNAVERRRIVALRRAEGDLVQVNQKMQDLEVTMTQAADSTMYAGLPAQAARIDRSPSEPEAGGC